MKKLFLIYINLLFLFASSAANEIPADDFHEDIVKGIPISLGCDKAFIIRNGGWIAGSKVEYHGLLVINPDVFLYFISKFDNKNSNIEFTLQKVLDPAFIKNLNLDIIPTRATPEDGLQDLNTYFLYYENKNREWKSVLNPVHTSKDIEKFGKNNLLLYFSRYLSI